MGVVTKRADELKPGDILLVRGLGGSMVERINEPGGGSVGVYLKGMDEATPPIFMNGAAPVPTFLPDLTSAQQHADALLAFVEAAADSPARTALLDKIHPPALPTLNEVMTALVGLSDPAVTAIESKRRIEALVAKARRAGWGA